MEILLKVIIGLFFVAVFLYIEALSIFWHRDKSGNGFRVAGDKPSSPRPEPPGAQPMTKTVCEKCGKRNELQ